ncbi:MAG: ATP-binding protein [Geobacteraceae bacterium]|nr:ATP-binding protein [Geobacteraceae bacterium]
MASEVELKIKVPNQTQYLALIGKIGEAVAREMCQVPQSKDFCGSDLNVVVTEAMANAIKHADATDPDIYVKIAINIKDNELLVSVYDSGAGFDLDSVPIPYFESASLDESGRGLFIIRSLMDSVVYKKVNGGNVLEMKKMLA